MRKKGSIWEEKNQALIVKSYSEGRRIPEIITLLNGKAVVASEFTVRSILKKNGVKAVWRMPLRKPDLWDAQVVIRIIKLRNDGKSLQSVSNEISEKFPDLKIPKSTVVRILEKNQAQITYQPYKPGDALPGEIQDKIVQLYQEDNTVKNILAAPELEGYSLNSRIIRSLLKRREIPLTGKKGDLRRWPDELQQRVVELHLEGMTFEEIKEQEGISANNPTDYAIRRILKNHGVITRRVATYREPIDEIRFRGYRDNRLRPEDVAIIHKHLAFSAEGRELMIKRMKLDMGKNEFSGKLHASLIKNVMNNTEAWKGLFKWAVQYLYDDSIKKDVFETGLNLGKAVRYLLKAVGDRDEARTSKAWGRIEVVCTQMRETYGELLGDPAKSFKLKEIKGDLLQSS